MRIGVIGSINVDLVVKVSRIPNRGETLSGESITTLAGGKGANQAVAISRLGGVVTMFGCIGDDEHGRFVVDKLKEENINTSYISTISKEKTGMALITVDNEDNSIVVLSGANNFVDRNYIDSVKKEILKHELIIMQNEIPQDTIEYVVDICYENKIKVMLNPAPAREISKDLINKLSYLIPNEHESKIIFGKESIEDMLRLYSGKLIVTEGEKGVRFASKDGQIISVPPRKSKVVDTTGAGDTFNGAFCVYLSTGKSLAETVKFANIAAGISTEKFGAQSGMPLLYQVLSEMGDEL